MSLLTSGAWIAVAIITIAPDSHRKIITPHSTPGYNTQKECNENIEKDLRYLKRDFEKEFENDPTKNKKFKVTYKCVQKIINQDGSIGYAGL